jgi:hypothetical protein
MSETQPHSPRQVLLGLFILFQLGFLIVSNFLGLINSIPSEIADKPKQLLNRVAPGFASKSGHGWEWSEQAQTNLGHWAQLTGQDQAWSLFAPGVSRATGFPAVVLLFDEPPTTGPSIPGTIFAYDAKNGFHLWSEWGAPLGRQPSLPLAGNVGVLGASNPWEALTLHAAHQFRDAEASPRAIMLLSDNEPADVHNYIRFGKSRLRRYEGQFYLNPQPKDDETPDELASRLTKVVRDLQSDYHAPLVEYLKWKRAMWMKEHPDAPAPTQVILMHRLYRICEPKEGRGLLEPHGWEGPLLVPMIRWQPAPPNDHTYLLEPFDFTDQRFYTVPR